MEWFKDGERNIRLFHAIVNGMRSRLKVRRIQNREEKWMQNQEGIAKAAIDFYMRQFTKQEENNYFEILEDLPRMISNEQKMELQQLQEKKKVKVAVMGLNRSSTGGPDGMT